MSNLERIAALLNMAERTENQHEADAFLAKAQALAATASVDLAVARATANRRERREEPVSVTITIGELRKAANKHLVELYLQVARANDLQMDIAHNSTYVIAYGMPSDIEVAQLLFNSLAVQMVTSGDRWVRSKQWQGDTYRVRLRGAGGRTRWSTREHTARTARGAFYAGFTDRIGVRLAAARREAVAARSAELDANPAALLSTAMVLRTKAAEVADFRARTSKARGTWNGYGGAATGNSHHAGRRAADAARIGHEGEIAR